MLGSAMSGWSALDADTQLLVAELVDCPCARAALALAHPRLGLRAQRFIPSYRGHLACLGMRITLGAVVDEALLRRYAARADATDAGCALLTANGRGGIHISQEDDCSHGAQSETCWRLLSTSDGEPAALLRKIWTFPFGHIWCSYEGDYGDERCVRKQFPNGNVQHFEGDKGAERCVRMVLTNGTVIHYEGEGGGEAIVRAVHANGPVMHYEGEKGAERFVRMVHPDGIAERLKCCVRAVGG